MAKPEAVFIYIGTYPDKAAAQDDYEVVKDLHALGVVGTYDVGVLTKDDQGKVHLHEHELARKAGGWGGAVVGAPSASCSRRRSSGPRWPAQLLVRRSATFGVACLARTSKSSGTLSMMARPPSLVVGEGKLEEALDKAELKAEKHADKELNVLWKDVDKAVEQAAKDVS